MTINSVLPATLPRARLLEAVHIVLRIARHPGKTAVLLADLERQAKQDTDMELAAHIVREIERTEGKPFIQLSRQKLESYSDELAAIVAKRVHDELDTNGASGEETLEAMRLTVNLLST